MALAFVLCPVNIATAAKQEPVYKDSVPTPDLRNVPYGEHDRQVFDFWKAESETPTPVVFAIHGGSWTGNSKEGPFTGMVDAPQFLKAGISIVAINYRLIKHAGEVTPPVKVCLDDAARALQFIRSNAEEYNIDKSRIALVGSSAGGSSALWLAYHDDLAQPNSTDPVSRESTRVCGVAVLRGQTSLDPKQMIDWVPNIKYGGHAFESGLKFPDFLKRREEFMPLINEYSPYALLTADDPATYLHYGNPPTGELEKDPTHSTTFGIKLFERCNEVGVKCDLTYTGIPGRKYKNTTQYLLELFDQ
jgi:acetyl esterase/lipase